MRVKEEKAGEQERKNDAVIIAGIRLFEVLVFKDEPFANVYTRSEGSSTSRPRTTRRTFIENMLSKAR